MRRYIYHMAIAALCVAAVPVHAQLNNRPFSFGNAGQGVGMSIGGKQAILNEEVFDMTPENMIRAPNGALLSIEEYNNGSALVQYQGQAVFIPSFRGTSYRDGMPDMAAGVFNEYFSPTKGGADFMMTMPPASSAVVSTWTTRVATGGSASYNPASSVDTWTGMVGGGR